MESTNAFLGDQPTGPRPANYEPTPNPSGGYPKPPAEPMAVQNANAYAVPDANVRPTVAPQVGAANQNPQAQAMPLEMMAGLITQETNMLISRLNEQQFRAISQAVQAHPINHQIQQEMAGNMIAMTLAGNTVIKLHLAYPQLPLDGIVNDVMGVVGHFKENQHQPGSIQALPSQFMGVAASYVMKHGNPQPLQAAPAAAPVAMVPQGLEQQAKPTTITAPGPSHHQGMMVPGQQHVAQVF